MKDRRGEGGRCGPSGGLWAGVGSALGAGGLWARRGDGGGRGGLSTTLLGLARPASPPFSWFEFFPLFILFMSPSLYPYLPQDTKSWSLEVGRVGGGLRLQGGWVPLMDRIWWLMGSLGWYPVLGGMGGGPQLACDTPHPFWGFLPPRVQGRLLPVGLQPDNPEELQNAWPACPLRPQNNCPLLPTPCFTGPLASSFSARGSILVLGNRRGP